MCRTVARKVSFVPLLEKKKKKSPTIKNYAAIIQAIDLHRKYVHKRGFIHIKVAVDSSEVAYREDSLDQAAACSLAEAAVTVLRRLSAADWLI